MSTSDTRAREILRTLAIIGPSTADQIAENEGVPHTYNIAPALTQLRKAGLVQWRADQNGKRVKRLTRRGASAGVAEITREGRLFIYDRSKSLKTLGV